MLKHSMLIFFFVFVKSYDCETVEESEQYSDREARQYNAPSDSYAAASSGYGAPSSGYGAPSGGYGAPSGGYGAPAGGYGAPVSGYDAGSTAPVYVYQQGQGQQQTSNAGGALAALLPLGALALLIPLGLLAAGAIFPVTTVVGGGAGRKRRSTSFNNTEDHHSMVLQNYFDTLEQLPDMNLHKDMVAKYLECGHHSDNQPSLHGCLQRLSCVLNDPTVQIFDNERDVGNIVLESIFNNEYVSKDLKWRIQVAGKKGLRTPGNCGYYKCHHYLLTNQH